MTFKLKVDESLRPLSSVVSLAKLREFEQILKNEENRDNQTSVELEIRDLQALHISLQILSNSPKVSEYTTFNNKLFKVTAYFVSEGGFEPRTPQDQRLFSWSLIYLEIAQRASDQSITIGLTEMDLNNVIFKLKQSLRVKSLDISDEILSTDMPRERILELVLDCLVMNPDSRSMAVSVVNLSARYQERRELISKFIISGGRFITIDDGQDPELKDFKTTVWNSEIDSRLVKNMQKDMSDKMFDIKIYEIRLKCLPTAKKFRFEIFWVDEPNTVFRCDYFSQDV